MSIRNRHRLGRHLVTDDESGFVYYDDEVLLCWDGTYRHKTQYEARHPQEFVRSKSDPKPVGILRPTYYAPTSANTQELFVGNTNIPTPVGPASHLFRIVTSGSLSYGIGEMIIEDPGDAGFVVA